MKLSPSEKRTLNSGGKGQIIQTWRKQTKFQCRSNAFSGSMRRNERIWVFWKRKLDQKTTLIDQQIVRPEGFFISKVLMGLLY